MDQQKHIILFDGVCNLCNGSVQAIIRKDKNDVIKFATLQSETGKQLLKDRGLAEGETNSIVYIKGDQYFLRSDAVLEIGKTLGRGWGVFYFLKFIPSQIRDGMYNLIARNRYKWFGKKNECVVPTPELKDKFL